MSSSRIGTLAAFVLVAVAALFIYVRTLPMVSDAELAEADVEVARIRAGLDVAECLRPALFDAPSQTALPRTAMLLRDFLRLDGPLAECWDAGRCSELPEELTRQAQAGDRCAPYLPPSEVGNFDRIFLRDRHPFVRRVVSLAESPEMSTDDRLRVVVQGMAVGRDLTQRPNGFELAQWGARIETELGDELAVRLETTTLSGEAQTELDHALGVLAAMPVDVNTFVSGEAIQHAEQSLRDAASGRGSMLSEEQIRWFAYGFPAFLRRLQQWCPPGGSVSGCISRFPRRQPTLPSALPTRVLGKWVLRREILECSLWSSSFSYANELMALEGLRERARSLQQQLSRVRLEEAR